MAKLKKVLEKTWFSIFLFTLICIGTSRVFKDGPRRAIRQLSTNTRSFEEEESSQLHSKVLFFNRVPKCGSEMLVLLLQWLQGENGFRHVRLPGGSKRRLFPEEQVKVSIKSGASDDEVHVPKLWYYNHLLFLEGQDTSWEPQSVSPIHESLPFGVEEKSLVEEIRRQSRIEETMPISFDRHVYFTNFTEFGSQYPIYVNLVRDPVDKLISRFYYGRVTPNPLNPDIKFIHSTTSKSVKIASFERCFLDQDPECSFQNGNSYDLSIPYFCGHHPKCMALNDRWALARAKSNVEQYFAVVGVLEELNSTLTVLENKIPVFFKGVKNMYFHELLEPHKNKNRLRPRQISANVRYKLKKQLWAEYDMYYWLRARLLQQEYT